MTNFSELSSTFHQLQALAPEAFMPLESETDLKSATDFLKAMDREIGEQAGHPLLPLAEILMQRIMAYEAEHYPIPPAAPDMELRMLMEEHGVTQQALAAATGINQGQISRLMSGKRSFTADHARSLAAFFKTNPSVFL